MRIPGSRRRGRGGGRFLQLQPVLQPGASFPNQGSKLCHACHAHCELWLWADLGHTHAGVRHERRRSRMLPLLIYAKTALTLAFGRLRRPRTAFISTGRSESLVLTFSRVPRRRLVTCGWKGLRLASCPATLRLMPKTKTIKYQVSHQAVCTAKPRPDPHGRRRRRGFVELRVPRQRRS